MNVETTRGSIDEKFLDKTEERVDDAEKFCVIVIYRFKDDGTQASKFVRPIWSDGSWQKTNRFHRTPDPEEMVLIEVDGVRSMRRAGDMEHRFGHVDDEREFTCWEEFWLPGVAVAVHREVHVKAKRGVEASSAVGTMRG